MPLLGALTLWVIAMTATAVAAPRPPLPAGGQQVAPGHLPGQCSAPGDDAYGPNYGYYWSPRSKAWISAPRCVPRWGNLALMPSKVTRAGGKVTMTAVPDQGSNSAEYAPQTKTISWTFPGRRVAGCGNADLSCTVVPFANAAKEWQWGLFHVTMPRTFFINSRGSNCAGIPICGGFATNAWAFAGVPPKGQEPPARITGTVEAITCASCGEVEPLAGVRVSAKGPDEASATTGADGTYSITVSEEGSYTVAAKRGSTTFVPDSRSVKVKGDVGGVDFRACAEDAAASSASLSLPRRARSAQTDKAKAIQQAGKLCPPEQIDWLMEKRFTAASLGRRDDDGLPPAKEVNPTSWTAALYTRSKGKKYVCDANVRFVWTVKPASRLVGGRLPKVGCKTDLHVTRLGTYEIKAQMQRRKPGGGVWRNSGKATRGKVELQDWLIAGVGDSNGSGEGNAPFYYPRCNRSVASYQVQTALDIERKDPHSSVTFIHTACSGASTDHLVSSTYAGTRGGWPPLPPQIPEVQRLLRAHGSAPKRDVDVVLMSIGVNDLGFGPTLKFCLESGLPRPGHNVFPACELRPVKAIRHKDGKRTGEYKETAGETTLADKLEALQQTLPGRYGGIQAALPKLGVRRDRVFLAQYPDFAYGDDGQVCGIELGSVVHFLPSTWHWLSAASTRLNQNVRAVAAAAGRSWVTPDYDFGAFLKRGYCSANSLFRSVGGALGAGDMGGPFHPTQEGHQIEKAGTLPAVCRKLYDGDATCNEPKDGA